MKISATVLLLCICLSLYAQTDTAVPGSPFRVMFYNVENLFDPFHDTLKNDHEFVSGGIRGNTWNRFQHKLNNISKVIINAGGWQPPEVVALCEVENRFVLSQMLKRTPLHPFGYRIIHHESPDERGIDVALLYRADRFRVLYQRPVITASADSSLKTRHILYVKGLPVNHNPVNNTDTLHVFVNHWPSRFGGIALSDGKRRDAAITLRRMVDSVTAAQPGALIVITGDFNDEPSDESVAVHLGARPANSSPAPALVNLMWLQQSIHGIGTNKYKGRWSVIDQIIVSSNLLAARCSGAAAAKAEILNFTFLLQPDEAYSGVMPFRTYHGMRYQGGFSDHLPIMLTLNFCH